jgi:hypothetical protein
MRAHVIRKLNRADNELEPALGALVEPALESSEDANF